MHWLAHTDCEIANRFLEISNHGVIPSLVDPPPAVHCHDMMAKLVQTQRLAVDKAFAMSEYVGLL